MWALAGALAGLAMAAPAVTITDVRIENAGTAPLDPDSIRPYLQFQPGDEFDRTDVSRSVRALEETGRFTSIDVRAQPVPAGIEVVIRAAGKRLLRSFEVEGARELNRKDFEKLLNLRIGMPIDDTTLGERYADVIEEYHKRYYPDAALTWSWSENPSAGTVDLTLRVEEGRRARVYSIQFRGNREFSSKELRREMGQSRHNPWNPWSWIAGSGKLERDDLATDAARLTEFYRNQGYLDARVRVGDIVALEPGKLTITMDVSEGRRYEVGEVDASGIETFEREEVMRGVALTRGAKASQWDIDRAAQTIEDYYSIRGYMQTFVRPRLTFAGLDTVDVSFDVAEGHKGYVRDIRIRGNRITRDKVIRRELVVLPGDLYDQTRIRRSEARLRNLGYFSRVSSYPESTPEPDRYDVVFDVEEQRMGQMTLGAGFSSVENISGFFEISHGNFSLSDWPPVGAGQKLKFRSTLGAERQEVEFSFVEPWFLDRKLSLGFDVFSRESRFLSDEYDQRNQGFNIGLGWPAGRFTRLNMKYGLENYDIYNVSSNASQRIRDEEGKRLKSSLTLTTTFDTRDNFYIPTRGTRVVLTGQLAGGVLGADTDIYSLTLNTSQYWPLWWDHILSLRTRFGVVEYYGDSERVPIFDRFFLGGPYTLRGFEYRDVGPIDEEGEPVGGQSMAFGSVEYSIPLMERVRFATYYDAGMVWEEAYTFEGDLNTDVGIGIRFDIPMFPLRFDYAWPVETDPHNDRSSPRFSFIIGYIY
jgi:outer membrane protein insertion porin family